MAWALALTSVLGVCAIVTFLWIARTRLAKPQGDVEAALANLGLEPVEFVMHSSYYSTILELWNQSKPCWGSPHWRRKRGSISCAFWPQRGASGMAAGELAAALRQPPSTLSFHLAALEQAQLIQSTRRGRQLIYAVRFFGLRSLFSFLTETCCSGRPELCGDLARLLPDDRRRTTT